MTADEDFKPYEGVDPDNINYVHSINYDQMRELIHSLPPGWKRLDQMTPGQPPYLHVPSGKTSWKNPNFATIMNIADEFNEGKRKENENDVAIRKQVKKLRLMLQAGAPLGAVEQKAKIEGIDMSLVLSPSDEKRDGKKRAEGDEKTAVTDDEDSAGAAIPETLVKKYKRMIKAGVRMDRVQQLASIETGASAEQVASIVQGGTGYDSDSGDKKEETSSARMKKFLKMQNAGIPRIAIQHAAQLQGHDMNEVNKALGIEGQDGDESKKIEKNSVKQSKSTVKSAAAKGDKANAPAKTSSSPHFTPHKGAVAFPSSRGGQNTFPLTDLVRKMAQTVQKASQFSMGSSSEMVVDELTLFHALGALKGVQFARDEYNSTIGAKEEITHELIYSKRYGFAEMAQSIGMTLPTNSTKADIEGLDDLILHIETVNQEELERGKYLLKDGFYDFNSIYTLYVPGSLVNAKNAGGGGVDCFCQVVWHRFTQGKTIAGKPVKYFQLCCRFMVPLGGGKSTFAEVVEGIEMFEGRRSVAASSSGAGLAFVPPSEHEIKDLLQKYSLRGETYNRVVSLDDQNTSKTHRYMEYEKGCFFQKHSKSFNARKASVALANSGRIVVDFDAAMENGHSISVGRDDLIQSMNMKKKEYKLHLRLMDKNKSNHPNADGSDSKGSGSVSAGNMILFSSIPAEYLALVYPVLVGFSLTSKSWGDVLIDHGLKDIAFETDVFDRLVLPESRKRMIKALVNHTSGFHDLVEGKGEGTVFLLYGPPGTGKTLTAEAIAEHLQRPLYSISMGTLGTTADALETRLSEILQLSARWDALVLLDEADSFMEARNSSSPLERNAMVSVMLRLVEYHRGILFLTSNRIKSLDPAFQTRITLALRYEPLDLEGREKIWTNLLIKSGFGSILQYLDVKALAKPVLNGREIKNALRLGMALAADEGSVLTQELLLETAIVIDGHKDSMKVDWNEMEKVKPSGWLWSCWRSAD